MDHQQAALLALEEVAANVEAYAGPDDVDRVIQFRSHLLTVVMVVEELHGDSSQAPAQEE